ncbi:MAG: hypothetical protein V1668_03300 [Patescibacteria group bacterium]
MNPLKTTYQRNLLMGTLISALLFLAPTFIWYFSQDRQTVLIDINDVKVVSRNIDLPKPTAESSYGKGPRGNYGGLISTERVSGFKVVPERALVDVASPSFTTKPTPDFNLISETSWTLGDEFGILAGTPEGDAWPIDPKTDKISGINRDYQVEIQPKIIEKPKPNFPAIIKVGQERWPKRTYGIDSASVTIVLYLDSNSNYLKKNGRINYELVSEYPQGMDFLYALLDMVRDGYIKSPVQNGISMPFKCQLTYIWCRGNNCPKDVTVVSGNIIASIQ